MSTSEATFGTAGTIVNPGILSRTRTRQRSSETLALYPGVWATLRYALANSRAAGETTTGDLRRLGRESGSAC